MRRTVAPAGPRKPPDGGEVALQALTRRKPLPANRTPPELEAPIVELSLELPACGQLRIPARSAAAAARSRRRACAAHGSATIWRP